MSTATSRRLIADPLQTCRRLVGDYNLDPNMGIKWLHKSHRSPVSCIEISREQIANRLRSRCKQGLRQSSSESVTSLDVVALNVVYANDVHRTKRHSTTTLKLLANNFVAIIYLFECNKYNVSTFLLNPLAKKACSVSFSVSISNKYEYRGYYTSCPSSEIYHTTLLKHVRAICNNILWL